MNESNPEYVKAYIRKLADGRTIDALKLLAHYKTLEGLDGWGVSVEWVIDLPVWGTCRPCPDNRTAHLQLRDPASKTQLRGMYTDLMMEYRDTFAHELMHCWTSYFRTQEPAAICVEENMVWALAGAIITAEGTPDAIVMKSALRSLSPSLRARIAAPMRRTKGRKRMPLSAEQVQKALEAVGDDSPAAAVLKEILASLITGNDAAPASEEDMGKEPPDGEDPKPGGEPPAERAAQRSVGRARVTEIDRHVIRAREAADVTTTEAIRSMVHNAREIDRMTIPAEVESTILRCKSVGEARSYLSVARAMAGQAPQRGRSGAEPIEGANNGGKGNTGPKGRELSSGVQRALEKRGRGDLIDRGRSTPAPKKGQ